MRKTVPVKKRGRAEEVRAAPAKAKPAVPVGAQPPILGHLDTCGPTHITGWVHDRTRPGQSLDIVVLLDGVPAARGRADLFRPDLKQLGLGEGNSGFSVAMPVAALDGTPHQIEVREARSGFALPTAQSTRPARLALDDAIRLDGAALDGTAKLAATNAFAIYAQDVDSGEIVARGGAEPHPDRPGYVRYYLPLAPHMFDGRPHAFTVRAPDTDAVLGSIALVMPFSLTPENAMLEYARNGMTPSLATAAGLRYEALSASVGRLAGDASAKDAPKRLADLQQLHRAHAALVHGHDPRRREYEPLVFPAVADPKVSIVVPAHNKFHVTYHCLCSLLLAPNNASFEVILVDDGSSDVTTQAAQLLKGVKIVRNERALGFIKASNRGAAAARGEYVVMLNNDTEVTPNWIDELLWPFDNIEGVGLTGAKLVYPDGTLQEAGGIVWNTGNPWNYGRNGNARHPKYNYTRQVDYISGACIMLPRALWKKLKGFSEDYTPAYFEDTDLAFRVRAEGLKTVYAPLAQVFHFEGTSSGTSTESGTKRFQEVNRPKFKAKWKRAFKDLGDEATNVDLVKDRNVGKRALIVDLKIPMPDKDAGSYATVQEIRLLQSLGFKCTLFPQNLAWMPGYTQEIQRLGIEAVYAPYYTSLHQLLEERGREFDLVYVYRYNIAQTSVDLIRQYAPQARIALMNADLHFLRELRSAIHKQDKEAKSRALQTRAEELQVMSKVDLVMTYTEIERTVVMSHIADATPIALTPWVVDIAQTVPGFSGRQDIAFLGGFSHTPNAEAVEWFAENVMPLLAKKMPQLKFRVYGSQIPDALAQSLAKHKNIVVEGWVKEVRDVYDRCRVFVAPLQSGAGIKGKVIGALAHGVPTVMSPVAAEGISISQGVDGFVVSKPEEWVEAIAQAYADSRAWSAMSAGSIAVARAQFGFGAGLGKMKAAMSEIGMLSRGAK